VTIGTAGSAALDSAPAIAGIELLVNKGSERV
jgi:hypothetical protein